MLTIEGLGKQHAHNRFDCGVDELNLYLRNTARQHLTKGISRTFVLIDDTAPSEILGFFTLSSCEIRAEKLPERYAKRYPLTAPAAKLARLAIAKTNQREGLGTLLMMNAIDRIITVSEHLGIIGFFVDAKDKGAKTFYEQFGFIPLPDSPLELFLPMETLRKAFKGS